MVVLFFFFLGGGVGCSMLFYFFGGVLGIHYTFFKTTVQHVCVSHTISQTCE